VPVEIVLMSRNFSFRINFFQLFLKPEASNHALRLFWQKSIFNNMNLETDNG
jgi:hypothetical protein